MGVLKKIIDILNTPIGENSKKISSKEREKNLKQKPLELTYEDTFKNPNNIKYTYKIRDKEGNITTSSLEALSKADVYAFLNNQGYDILSIEKDELYNQLGISKLTKRQMKDKDINFFLTQLSTIIKSGIPLIDAVGILSKQVKSKRNKDIYNRLVFELSRGRTFSEALDNQEGVFPRLLINMVKTAELTGNLTGVLDDMADYYKTSDENRKQIISAITYPVVILIIAIVVLTYIILYVVPSFTDMYDQLGSELPAITLAIMNFSDFLATNLVTVIISIILIFAVFTLLYKNNKKVRYLIQLIIMKLPIIKSIIINKEIIMFTKTFASLINYDVFITDSMEILETITDNEIYKKLISTSIKKLSKGEGVSPAFKDNWAFPTIAYEMLLTGERTGKLGLMMNKVAEYYSDEQKNLVTRLKSLIEPIMIALLAIIVGIILLAVIVPMFNMYNNIM